MKKNCDSRPGILPAANFKYLDNVPSDVVVGVDVVYSHKRFEEFWKEEATFPDMQDINDYKMQLLVNNSLADESAEETCFLVMRPKGSKDWGYINYVTHVPKYYADANPCAAYSCKDCPKLRPGVDIEYWGRVTKDVADDWIALQKQMREHVIEYISKLPKENIPLFTVNTGGPIYTLLNAGVLSTEMLK